LEVGIIMNAKELRQQVSEALEGLEGDTGPVRKLIFDLAHQMGDVKRRLGEVEVELSRAKVQAAADRARGEGLGVEVQSLRQRLEGLEGNLARAEQALAEAKRPKTISRAAVLAGIARLRPRMTAEFAAGMDAISRRTMERALGLEPGALDYLTDTEVRGLFHLGFDEYCWLLSMTGDMNRYPITVKDRPPGRTPAQNFPVWYDQGMDPAATPVGTAQTDTGLPRFSTRCRGV
jgi:hypothetical protein